jgi:hypothetical protein
MSYVVAFHSSATGYSGQSTRFHRRADAEQWARIWAARHWHLVLEVVEQKDGGR